MYSNTTLSLSEGNNACDSVWPTFSKWSLMITNFAGIQLRIHMISLLGLIFLFQSPEFYIFVLITILLHEYGHIIASKMCHLQTKGIILIPPIAGFSIINYENSSYVKNILVYLAGSAFNLITAFVIYLFIHEYRSLIPHDIIHYLYNFAITSFVIGTINLIPLYPLDGGKIILEVLSMTNLGRKKTEAITFYISSAVFIPIAAWTVIAKDWIDLFIAGFLITVSFITLKS